MVKRLLVLLAALLLSASLPPGSGEAGDIAPAMGFVCRVLPARNVAVVTSLTGLFPPDSRIRFLDDEGNICATGIVRSSYPDLSYIALDNGQVCYYGSSSPIHGLKEFFRVFIQSSRLADREHRQGGSQ